MLFFLLMLLLSPFLPSLTGQGNGRDSAPAARAAGAPALGLLTAPLTRVDSCSPAALDAAAPALGLTAAPLERAPFFSAAALDARAALLAAPLESAAYCSPAALDARVAASALALLAAAAISSALTERGAKVVAADKWWRAQAGSRGTRGGC